MADRDEEDIPLVRDILGDDAERREPPGDEPWEWDPYEDAGEVFRISRVHGLTVERVHQWDMEGGQGQLRIGGEFSRAAIEDLLSATIRAQERWRRVDRWLRDRACAAPDGGGDPRADWIIAFMATGSTLPPESLPDYFSRKERLAALWRILGRMGGPPIFPKRWKDNEEAIYAELANLESSVDDRAQAAGWRAGWELTERLTPAEIAKTEEELLKKLLRAVQKLVFDDIVGPTYRRRGEREVDLDARPKTPETIYTDPDFASRFYDRDELGYLLGAAGLTDGERDVFELARRGLDTEEIAERLDTTPQAIYTRRYDGKKKLEALAREIGA